MKKIRDFLGGFREGFRKFGLQVAGIVNLILLGIVYIVGLGPVSFLYRISGKHFLDLEKGERKSYYDKREYGGGSMEDYYRPF
jgi:hypothetical protein